MIVKVFANKGGGSAGASIDYLLGKDRLREGAEVLKGDAELSLAIAESLEFQNKYTVGCLSFEEKELPETTKAEIMERFEKTIFSGMEKDQYNIAWIEHNDKGRVELNFFIPNMEMTTGKRFQPYYDRADRALVDSFKRVINHEYGLSSPDDGSKRQLVQLNPRVPKKANELKKELTAFFVEKISKGELTNRTEIIDTLKGVGLEVSRVTGNSISIKNPEEGGRNIRLTGEIYKEEFYDSIRQAQTGHGTGLEREEAERESAVQGADGAEFDRVQAKYERCLASRSEKHERLYPKLHNEPDRSVSDYFAYIGELGRDVHESRVATQQERAISEAESRTINDRGRVGSVGERENIDSRGRESDLHSERINQVGRIQDEEKGISNQTDKVKGFHELFERVREIAHHATERAKRVIEYAREASKGEFGARERIEHLQAEREQSTGVRSRESTLVSYEQGINERAIKIDEIVGSKRGRYSELVDRCGTRIGAEISTANEQQREANERKRAFIDESEQSIIGFNQFTEEADRAITRTERRINPQKEAVMEHFNELVQERIAEHENSQGMSR